MQETWIRIWQAIPHFEERSTLRTWMLQILFNVVRASAKRQRAAIPLSVFEDVDHEVAARAGDSPEDRAEWGEQLSVLSRVLGGLPELQRRVVLMRGVGQLDSAEVTALLGVTAGHQRVLLHRARAQLHTALAAHERGDEKASSGDDSANGSVGDEPPNV